VKFPESQPVDDAGFGDFIEDDKNETAFGDFEEAQDDGFGDFGNEEP
jgi:hypothetical protein